MNSFAGGTRWQRTKAGGLQMGFWVGCLVVIGTGSGNDGYSSALRYRRPNSDCTYFSSSNLRSTFNHVVKLRLQGGVLTSNIALKAPWWFTVFRQSGDRSWIRWIVRLELDPGFKEKSFSQDQKFNEYTIMASILINRTPTGRTMDLSSSSRAARPLRSSRSSRNSPKKPG